MRTPKFRRRELYQERSGLDKKENNLKLIEKMLVLAPAFSVFYDLEFISYAVSMRPIA
jgi:hypothetical protein